ncbi:MAG: hypothetical protein K2X66_13325 [Cyanobacteria bacterium]|nr:hypothetical protein [Cyanobacteriota bacterium]
MLGFFKKDTKSVIRDAVDVPSESPSSVVKEVFVPQCDWLWGDELESSPKVFQASELYLQSLQDHQEAFLTWLDDVTESTEIVESSAFRKIR